MEVERDVSMGADVLRVNTRLSSLLPIRRTSRRSTGAPGDVVDVGAVGRPVPILPGGAPDLGLDAVVAEDGGGSWRRRGGRGDARGLASDYGENKNRRGHGADGVIQMRTHRRGGVWAGGGAGRLRPCPCGLGGVGNFVLSAENRRPMVIAKRTREVQSDESRPFDLIRWNKSVIQISLVQLTGWL